MHMHMEKRMGREGAGTLAMLRDLEFEGANVIIEIGRKSQSSD
jgi:hypothetical protein